MLYLIFQDYMQNVHGKEIDLLRTTVKVPGKRPPRAVVTVAPTASPKTNGLTKDRSTLQLGIGATSEYQPRQWCYAFLLFEDILCTDCSSIKFDMKWCSKPINFFLMWHLQEYSAKKCSRSVSMWVSWRNWWCQLKWEVVSEAKQVIILRFQGKLWIQ